MKVFAKFGGKFSNRIEAYVSFLFEELSLVPFCTLRSYSRA